jgi:hypothetical protein
MRVVAHLVGRLPINHRPLMQPEAAEERRPLTHGNEEIAQPEHESPPLGTERRHIQRYSA